MNHFGTEFANFSVSGRFFQITQICRRNLQRLATSGRYISEMITNRENSRPNDPLRDARFLFLPLESTQSFPWQQTADKKHTLKVHSLDCSLLLVGLFTDWRQMWLGITLDLTANFVQTRCTEAAKGSTVRYHTGQSGVSGSYYTHIRFTSGVYNCIRFISAFCNLVSSSPRSLMDNMLTMLRVGIRVKFGFVTFQFHVSFTLCGQTVGLRAE